MHKDDLKKIANFLFEASTLRRIPRMHRQTLMVNDDSDNIATHSHRVALIAWFIAKEEGIDIYKTLMMALLHDIEETRIGDQNWIHKRYVTVHNNEVRNEQLGGLPHKDLSEIVEEYERRESKEAIAAKDADLLDQVLLLREYELQGNKEATVWLNGKGEGKTMNRQLQNLKTETGKRIGLLLSETDPGEWWAHLWTDKNRK